MVVVAQASGLSSCGWNQGSRIWVRGGAAQDAAKHTGIALALPLFLLQRYLLMCLLPPGLQFQDFGCLFVRLKGLTTGPRYDPYRLPT